MIPLPYHRSLILVYLALMLLTGCDFNLSKNPTQQYTYRIIKDSKNIYLDHRSFSNVIFAPDSEEINFQNRFMPTVEDIIEAESIFQNCLKLKEKDINGILTDASSIRPISKYYRQYFGYITPDGQKVIIFNCFLKSTVLDEVDWKIRELLVRDGGNAYFQVEINIKSKTCNDFMVNGNG